MLARRDFPSNWEKCLFGVSREFAALPRHECVEGTAGQDPKIILWGDSHAATLIPMLTQAFPDAAVYQLTMGGCPPVLGYEAQVPWVSKSCREFNRLVIQEIVDLKKKGLEGVVVSARWNMYLRRRSLALSEVQSRAAPAAEDRANEHLAHLSPDGKWMAYVSDEGGRHEVWVRAFPEGAAVMQVSQDGGTEPVWAPDGRTLYYRDRTGSRVHAVPVTMGAVPQFGTPVVTTGYWHPGLAWTRSSDIRPDGRALLLLPGYTFGREMRVVLNISTR